MKKGKFNLTNLFVVFIFCLLCLPSFVLGREKMTAEKWREDIKFLSEELPKKHLNLYHTTPKATFDEAFKKLYERVPELEDHEIIVELSRITALIGDGHSGMRIYSDPKIAFNSFPVRFYLYEDGMFVRRIERNLARLAGAKVVKVGKLPVEEAIKAVTPLISRDNEMWAKFYAPYFLATPEILHALKITDDLNSATFEFEKDGKRSTVTLKPKGKLLLEGHAQTEKGIDGIDFVDARPDSIPTPLWLKGNPENSYWFEYLEDSKTVYFRYNEVQHKKEERIPKFAERMFKFIEDNEVEKFVIDMRWNRGGSNKLSRPFLLGIIRAKKIDQRGKLFLIIGRRTFSAAQYFVNELEMYTNVIVVGEPTAQKVNKYGDNFKILLPNSGIKVRASFVRFEQMGPWDKRIWTAPHIATELTSEDYRKGVDPALKEILGYISPPPLETLMTNEISKNGLASGIALYHKFKRDKKNKYVNTELPIFRVAYGLFMAGKVSDAITLLKLNAEYYPDEPGPYELLGQAYERTNQLKLAKEYFEIAYRNAQKKGDDVLSRQIKESLNRVSKKLDEK